MLIGTDTVKEICAMRKILISVLILVAPAVLLYLFLQFFDIGNSEVRLVVSVCFGIVLSSYVVLKYRGQPSHSVNKEHSDFY